MINTINADFFAFMETVDLTIFKFIHITGASSWGDWFFPAITDLNKNIFISSFLLLLMISTFVFYFKRQGFSFFLFLALAVSFSDFTGKHVKNYFQRPRPFVEAEKTGAIQKSPAQPIGSFYSNHTSNMFTFATYTGLLLPQYKLLVFAVASLVAYSRIYNGVHYPSDVLAGVIMGIFYGYLFYKLARYLEKRLSLKKGKKQ